MAPAAVVAPRHRAPVRLREARRDTHPEKPQSVTGPSTADGNSRAENDKCSHVVDASALLSFVCSRVTGRNAVLDWGSLLRSFLFRL